MGKGGTSIHIEEAKSMWVKGSNIVCFREVQIQKYWKNS